jgi:cytochrome P450
MQAVISSAVEEQEQLMDESKTSGKKFFLQKLLSLAHSEKTKLERHRLTGNVLTLFLGGTDTSAKTLTHALYILARNPILQETLRKEVDQFMKVDGDDTKSSLDTATLDDLYTKLPRLKSFLHEVHRCYGVSFFLWTTLVDIPFCGTTLPTGTKVMVMSHYISTNSISPSSKVPLGPNNEAPHVFCPERYLVQSEDGSFTCPNPQTQGGAFLTFGNGVRACPGRMYAEALSYIVLASLLGAFDWELAPNHPISSKIIFDLVLMPDCEVYLKLTPRSGVW